MGDSKSATVVAAEVSVVEVWWEPSEDEDPQNPQNWPDWSKWLNIITISSISFIMPFISSMVAPAVPLIMTDLNTKSDTFATFIVSIFVLGFASGPLILAPLSELYGRVRIYNVTNILLTTFTAGCGFAQTTGQLLAMRFLSGFFGVATVAIGSGSIADLMPKHKRGKAASVWSAATVLGPTIGPIIGGKVTEAAGWRWLFWSISMVAGVMTIASFIILRETYPAVLLARKAARLRKHTNNPNYRSRLASAVSPAHLFVKSIVRPTRLLLFCPMVTILCTYVAIVYGTLYLLWSTYSFVFGEVYGFSPLATGLVFLPGGIATLLGPPYVAYFSDRTIKRRTKAGYEVTPEDRLPPVISLPGTVLFPAGLLIYGWAVEYGVHWAVPMLGTAVSGFASIPIFIGVQTYLIDAFEEYAASAVAANAVLRGLVGALLPLSGLALYRSLGWGWGNTLLAFLAVLFGPVPVLFGGKYGAMIREWSRRDMEL
ncbi:hypothetical protein MCOR07_003730 [Pyricularia oryzae]|uniref:Major facilitator superfamily (MFS) profile domain-containing protein n=1 Tax=Pyricularia grisea TaxID=148305 RepID=A0ABQ8NPM7_PYRGI|nr:hypothetical protein MCOR33_004360 [Pyricularia grisea]KAI6330813.1 hypothetical protein MCOR29_001755 [Pyricularia oryzae]KAI6385830.1 hypothetical protein MCOR32_001261 [Pyricularia oryzae]KAI6410372.1 hypothetical protein MCOR23_000534 [Pyricularia oryzae]KAI6425372.1 hypothetical protein MCOR21_007254 [Pyricularia oryzae]